MRRRRVGGIRVVGRVLLISKKRGTIIIAIIERNYEIKLVPLS